MVDPRTHGHLPLDEQDREPPLEPRPDPYWKELGSSQPDGPKAGSRDGLAALALGSALASFVFLWGVGGLLAIGLGVAARSETRAGSGRRSSAMAAFAIALGAANVLVTATLAALLILWWGQSRSPWQDTPTSLTAHERTHSPRSLPRPISKPVRNTFVGQVQLIDIDVGVPSLQGELERQWEAAHQAGERLLVWLVVPACAPCDAVARALPDPRMQEALRGVRLVRLDAARFQRELERLRLPTQALPGFALVGRNGRPLDYVHGGEWDEDIAPNIAPVLGKFTRGKYEARRYPWRGGAREDETAL